jgi:hypothetical protein
MKAFQPGDRVIVRTELGREFGTVLWTTNPKFRDRMVNVQFNDGTNSTWPIMFVSHDDEPIRLESQLRRTTEV